MKLKSAIKSKLAIDQPERHNLAGREFESNWNEMRVFPYIVG